MSAHTLYASQCPSCDFKNKPGSQFCDECGVALNLRPCPACGKVDDVTAVKCSGCGVKMPPLVVIRQDGSDEKPATPDKPGASAKPIGIRAGPMILVAIVAGGLPFFWMNRAYLPLPNAWQFKGPDAKVVIPATEVIPPVPALRVVTEPEKPVAPPHLSATASAPGEPAKTEEAPTQHPPPAKKSHAKNAAHRCTEGVAALGLCDPARKHK